MAEGKQRNKEKNMSMSQSEQKKLKLPWDELRKTEGYMSMSKLEQKKLEIDLVRLKKTEGCLTHKFTDQDEYRGIYLLHSKDPFPKKVPGEDFDATCRRLRGYPSFRIFWGGGQSSITLTCVRLAGPGQDGRRSSNFEICESIKFYKFMKKLDEYNFDYYGDINEFGGVAEWNKWMDYKKRDPSLEKEFLDNLDKYI